MSVNTVIDEFKNEISEVNGSIEVACTYRDWSGDITREDTDRESGVSADKVKAILLEKVIEQEDPETESSLKALFRHIKAKLPDLARTVYTRVVRKKGGYSEYTWWWDTQEKEGPIELVDLNDLYREIDAFSATFNKQ